ncbi:MAG: FG-GAP repeat protein [Ahniella sp.]|nr:FG-GAP repeat protein [Ahniella sp.]
MNGDGYADILVGAPFFDDAARVDSGQVQLFFGGPGTVRHHARCHLGTDGRTEPVWCECCRCR